MSGITSFAIFGLGKFGSHILSSLLGTEDYDASTFVIHILTRPGTPAPLGHPENVLFYPIDYSDPLVAKKQLVEALNGIDVVLSTVGSGVEDPKYLVRKLLAEGKHCGYIPGYANQAIVSEAAKEAGCRLFVPAEYGSPTHTLDPIGPSFIRGKKLFHMYLKDMGLPYLLLYTGKFIEPDSYAPRFYSLQCDALTFYDNVRPTASLPPNTIALGETPYPTARCHAAEFLVQILLNLPFTDLDDGIFMIRGHRREVLQNGKWYQFEDPEVSVLLSSELREASIA